MRIVFNNHLEDSREIGQKNTGCTTFLFLKPVINNSTLSKHLNCQLAIPPERPSTSCNRSSALTTFRCVRCLYLVSHQFEILVQSEAKLPWGQKGIHIGRVRRLITVMGTKCPIHKTDSHSLLDYAEKADNSNNDGQFPGYNKSIAQVDPTSMYYEHNSFRRSEGGHDETDVLDFLD